MRGAAEREKAALKAQVVEYKADRDEATKELAWRREVMNNDEVEKAVKEVQVQVLWPSRNALPLPAVTMCAR